MSKIDDAPAELQLGIKAFWPNTEWDNAAAISELESGWDAFAENDSTQGGSVPCGTVIAIRGGVKITAEHSISYFQINACNFPGWEWARLFNVMHNCGTAHMLWADRGWQPWYFSAQKLGLL